MLRLLMIADDFTGALDTGVQLAAHGIPTQVVVGQADLSACSSTVLVVDTETRHLSAAKAAEAVARLTRSAVENGVGCIYKKTDSALRGNIGAELAALLKASGARNLPFLPAFPQIGRTTKKGVHYIDGVPVNESPFGIDPFEPVRCAEVTKLIHLQTDMPAQNLRPGETASDKTGILVYDAATAADLEAAGRQLFQNGTPPVLAGCAGFAAFLPELLGLSDGSVVEVPQLDPRLLAAPAAALEKCRELAGDMAALARDNLRRGVAALTEVQPASAKELRRQEERIDRMEDVLGTFLVRLSGQTLTRRANARAAELLALIGDFERLGDHAMNLLESGEELRDKDISLPAEDRRELRVLTDAVEEIADLALDAFRREDPAAQAEVEALEQVIDGLKEQLRSRRIRRMQQGSGTMELGFVWSDVLTDLERAADHCSNIAGCVAGLPDGNQGLHAAQTALRQQDPAFEDRVRRYAEKYRV